MWSLYWMLVIVPGSVVMLISDAQSCLLINFLASFGPAPFPSVSSSLTAWFIISTVMREETTRWALNGTRGHFRSIVPGLLYIWMVMSMYWGIIFHIGFYIFQITMGPVFNLKWPSAVDYSLHISYLYYSLQHLPSAFPYGSRQFTIHN